MNLTIIGYSNKAYLEKYGKIKQEEYEEFLSEYAELLAKHFDNTIVTPNEGVYADLALKISKLKGKKPFAFYPDKDTFYGFEHLKPNFEKYDIKPINGDWYKLNAEQGKKSQIILCVGISPGSMIELAYIKYHQKWGGKKDSSLKNIHLLIDERCIDQRLPRVFHDEINNIHYFKTLKELENIIINIKNKKNQ